VNTAREIIAATIRESGDIPFARFMELALYCPVYGYYEKETDTVGRRGDFYTSVSVGRLFGELLAFQFAAWLEEVQGPNSKVQSPKRAARLVEAGAHDGQLALDILRWLRSRRPERTRSSFEYVIVEPSARRRERQRQTLREFEPTIRWVEHLGELETEGVEGILFSNELLDALPVHRLGWDAAGRRWFEWGVTLRDGTFAWSRMECPMPSGQCPTSNAQCPQAEGGLAEDGEPGMLPEWPAAVLEVLPDGFVTESCPAATGWWAAAAKVLRRGRLMTIDYGLTAGQFFAPERKGGTLRAYARHHHGHDLLANPGDQDLTAHVNFSAVRSAGEAAGLRTEALISQAAFLTQIAPRAWSNPAAFGEWTTASSRQFQTLTHPEHLGRAFQVLIQSRAG
jgi:SAM-dependent MidA family methyltransferase